MLKKISIFLLIFQYFHFKNPLFCNNFFFLTCNQFLFLSYRCNTWDAPVLNKIVKVYRAISYCGYNNPYFYMIFWENFIQDIYCLLRITIFYKNF